MAHRVAHPLRDLLGGAFGGLERDVAGEALGDEDVDRALAEVVALDEAVIAQVGQRGFTQHATRRLDLLYALDLFDADIEQTDRRAIDVEDDARHRCAHDRQVDQVLGVGADRRADVEDDRFAAQSRPHRGDRRPLDLRHGAQADLGHRHQRAGVASRNRVVGLALLPRLDRLPHRRRAPAGA